MPFTAVFRLRAFVHHDGGVARFRRLHRYHGHVCITRDGDGQRRFGGIAVCIRDGIGEFFRPGVARGHVHTRVQLIGIGAVRVQGQRAMETLHRSARRTAFHGTHRLARRSVRAEFIVGQHIAGRLACLRLRFRQVRIVGLRLRHVVVHFHRERTFCRIARGIRHTDGDCARQAGIRSGTVETMRLGSRKLVVIAYRPGSVRTQRRAGHRHGNAVHGHHAARHIRTFAGNSHLPAAFTAHGNHAVFAVQLHRERTAAALAMPFVAVLRLRAFIHQDAGFTRFRRLHRHHGHVCITRDADGQRRFGGIVVRIRDGVGKFFRPDFARGHVHPRVQLIAIGAVRVQDQRAMKPLHRPARRTAFHGTHRLVRRSVRAEFIVGQHIAGRLACLRLRFRQVCIVGHSLRHIVGDDHAHHTGAGGAVGIRHRHHEVVSDAVRPLPLVLLRGLREMIGIVQPAAGGVEARHFQIALVRGHGIARESSVEDQHAADDDGGHAIGGIDQKGTGGCGNGALRTAKPAFLHAQNIAPDACRVSAVMRIVRVVDDGNVVVDIAGGNGREDNIIVDVSSRGRSVSIGRNLALSPAHIQTAQTVQTVQKTSSHIIMETVAVALSRSTGGTSGRQEVGLIHGHEEILACDLRSLHLEGWHVVLGIGGVEILKTQNGPIFKRHQQIVAVPGKDGFVRGKIKDKMAVGSAGNDDGTCGFRPDEMYVCHGDSCIFMRKSKRPECKKPRAGNRPERGFKAGRIRKIRHKKTCRTRATYTNKAENRLSGKLPLSAGTLRTFPQ